MKRGCTIYALTCVVLLAAACSPRIVERFTTTHDTTYVERLRIDSLYQRDSVFVREKGDTVYIYTEKVRDRYRLLRDTVRLVQIDSVAYETVKEVKVEQPLSAWKSAKIRAFWWLVAGLAGALLWIFRKPLLNILRL